ncbi:MAG: diguanylate cyclase, partial [Anaerolineae bacterium]|nr:diguanylate cyclase [Anaerolineae bacterium]
TILLFLGVNTLQRRDTPATTAFAAIMFSASLWSFGFAAEVISTSLQGKIFWANIQFMGISVLTFSWFAMTLHHTGQPRWTIRSLFGLSIIPLITILVIWTNPYHHLFRVSPSLKIITSSFSVLKSNYGIYFYAVHIPFNYLLYAISFFLLFSSWKKVPLVYRRQRLILTLSLVFPFLVDSLYVVGFTPIPEFNFAPIAFSISGLLMSWNVFSLQFFDISQLANDIVVRTMQVGVIVLDKEGRITDINPIAEKITGISLTESIGISFAQNFPDYTISLESASDEEVEITLEQEGEKHYYHTKISPVFDKRKNIVGRVITLHNVSELVNLYRQVREVSQTDSLTGVLNRRAFIEKGENEIARTVRHKKHLSVIMMDIDDFKNINDELGHQYGDKSLITITQICRQEMRATDEIARYGGDEFIILLPETSATNAFNLAERICNNIADYKCLTESGESCTLSASLGVAEFDGIETLGSLLHRADQALYEAKHAGKGQVKLI